LKPFTDIIELLQHVHEDHHSFAADSNRTFDKNEDIFVPNAILNGNEYDLVRVEEETNILKAGEKRHHSYENMTYVCSICHDSFASKTDFYKDYLKHIEFFKCEICKSEKTQFGTRSEYVSHMKNTHFIQGDLMTTKRTVKCSVENCTKKVQTKTIRGFDGSRVIIPKLKLDMPNQRLMSIEPIVDMWDEIESSDDEEDPLDSILRRLHDVKTIV
jgi:hypothetical protein